jgi:hypothetical protein
VVHTRLVLLTAVLGTSVFWDTRPSRLVDRDRRLGACCLPLKVAQEAAIRWRRKHQVLRSFCTFLPMHTASYPERRRSSICYIYIRTVLQTRPCMVPTSQCHCDTSHVGRWNTGVRSACTWRRQRREIWELAGKSIPHRRRNARCNSVAYRTGFPQHGLQNASLWAKLTGLRETTVVVWGVTPRRKVYIYREFGCPCSLHLQGTNSYKTTWCHIPEDWPLQLPPWRSVWATVNVALLRLQRWCGTKWDGRTTVNAEMRWRNDN